MTKEYVGNPISKFLLFNFRAMRDLSNQIIRKWPVQPVQIYFSKHITSSQRNQCWSDGWMCLKLLD